MSLADLNEPLILADGTKIDPTSGKVIHDDSYRGGFVEIPSNSKAQAIVAKTRRSVAELPLPSNQMNAVSLVLFYSMYGLADQDIAIVIGSLSTEQVKNIKQLPEYQVISDKILETVLEYESNDIATFFKQNASKAAQKLVNIAMQEDGALGLKATESILDRSGHRPADVVMHHHKIDDTLKIEYVSKSKAVDSIPTVDTTFIDITPKKDS
jgi:hypothetical protein